MDGLKNGDAFPGIVRDDTAVFDEARARGLTVKSFQLLLTDQRFQDFESILDAERAKSQYLYGFPDGDGDCNCITWLERMGLPLLTGHMKEFIDLWWTFYNRRFGKCL